MASKLVSLEESFHEIKDNPNFICPHCGKQLASASGHRRHVLGHSHGQKPFKCLICEKTFVERHHYEGHVNSHQKITPYFCLHCRRRFSYKTSFHRHRSVCPQKASTKTEFQCEICKMKFQKKDILKDHLKGKHNDVGLYECDICGKRFKWRFSRAQHKKSIPLSGKPTAG